MNKDWYQACTAFSELTNIPVERAVGLSLLLWIGRDIGDVSATGVKEYPAFIKMLEGKKPFNGRWAKSEERKKTKGTVRPDDDPTCYPFKDFWNDYGKKKAIKEAKLAYSKLGEEVRAEIKRTLQFYLNDSPDLQYRLMPSTYINSSRWEDYKDTVPEKVAAPEGSKYKEQYESHIEKWTTLYPTLSGSGLFLSYNDFELIRDGEYGKLKIPTIGPDLRDKNMKEAYRVAAVSRKKVIDTFIKLCSDAPV